MFQHNPEFLNDFYMKSLKLNEVWEFWKIHYPPILKSIITGKWFTPLFLLVLPQALISSCWLLCIDQESFFVCFSWSSFSHTQSSISSFAHSLQLTMPEAHLLFFFSFDSPILATQFKPHSYIFIRSLCVLLSTVWGYQGYAFIWRQHWDPSSLTSIYSVIFLTIFIIDY